MQTSIAEAGPPVNRSCPDQIRIIATVSDPDEAQRIAPSMETGSPRVLRAGGR